MTTILEKLETLATIENARAWETAKEKYLFCDNLISGADIWPNEARVEVLEALFEAKLYEDSINRTIERAFVKGNNAPSNKWP